jgi:hypothetical protein
MKFLPWTRGRKATMEHFYMAGSLGNTLSWGDQQIIEPIDKVLMCRPSLMTRNERQVMKRNVKRRRFNLDNNFFVTMKDTLFDIENTKVSELLGVGMVITNATLDEAKRDEQEATAMRNELEDLRHQAEYYQDTTQEKNTS